VVDGLQAEKDIYLGVEEMTKLIILCLMIVQVTFAQFDNFDFFKAKINKDVFVAQVTPTTTVSVQLRGTGDIIFDWGDGSQTTYTLNTSSNTTCSHSYSSTSTVTLRIYQNSRITRMENFSNVNWTFDLLQLSKDLTYFAIGGSNVVTGSLTSLPLGITFIIISGLNTVKGYTSNRIWANNFDYLYYRPTAGNGLSSTEVDNLLIDLANVSTFKFNKTIDVAGNNNARTSASDAAVAILLSKGVTVVTN